MRRATIRRANGARARRTGGVSALVALSFLLCARDGHAIRFALGVASEAAPIVVDSSDLGPQHRFLLSFRPVLEVEPARWIAFGAYAPFTVLRAGDEDAASSGAESVFGVSASGRYPILRATEPAEILAYATLRGGFGTSNGRAGPFWGTAIGTSATWTTTGRGLFAEAALSRLRVADAAGAGSFVDRWTIGVSIGLVFHLGGEEWSTAAPARP